MKKIYLLAFLVVSISAAFSQSNVWVKQITGTGLKDVKVAEDTEANLFIAGMFSDSLQLDSLTLISGIGTFQFFVAKFDALRKLLGYQVYYTDYEYERPLVRNLEIDKIGQIYLSGNFYNGLYNAKGDTLLFTITSLDDFIIKLDNNLDHQWIHRLGGSNNTDVINSVVVDDNGNLFLAGAMSRTFDYDLSDGTFSLTGGNSGSPFLVKYDADLGLQWAQVLQSVKWDGVLDIANAEDGTIYTVTQISDSVYVPRQSDTLLVETNGDIDLMVNKWSATGEILWTQFIQGTARETFYNIAIGDDGSLFIFLQSNSPILFMDTEELSQIKGADMFLIKINPDGTTDWINQMPTTVPEHQGRMLVLEDRFILTGTYNPGLSLNSRNEIIEISLQSGDDFLAAYNFEGELLAVTSLSGNQMRRKSDIRVNDLGQILAVAPLISSYSFHPLPAGSLDPTIQPNSVIAKFCFPRLENLKVETTCLEGELTLISDPQASSTAYYLTETAQVFTGQDTLFLPSENQNIIVTHFDQDQCPLYETIDQTTLTCTTPTYDQDLNLDISLYPNPFVSTLHVNWNAEADPNFIYIFNSLGQKVLQKDIDLTNHKEINLDLDHLVKGVYLLHIYTQAGLLTRKLIKS